MQACSILPKKEDPMVIEVPGANSDIVEKPGIPRIIRKPAARLLLVMTFQSAHLKPMTAVVLETGKAILWQVRTPVLAS
jgi:hypothetical protein